VLEDVNEPLYRLDRMLTQLAIAGKFDEAAAILLGDFSPGDTRHSETGPVDQEWLWQRVLDLTASSGIPVWAGLPSGHRPENLTLPIAPALSSTAVGDVSRSVKIPCCIEQ